MAHQLAEAFRNTLVGGLKRKSVTTCSRWARMYRVMGRPFPGPWSSEHHPWTDEMMDSEAQVNVGQKSAQAGYTEVCLNKTFYNLDIRRIDCLYVLPNKTPDASDFSASRFDGALELSDHLAKLFSDVKNVGHKRAGATNLYIRGSNSRGGLKSLPVGFIVFDELDEMNHDNVVLALERTSGQVEKQVWNVSTPTVPGIGINELFERSTKEHFMFKCPCCGRFTELLWPESIVITAEDPLDPKLKDTHIICKECKTPLKHKDKPDFLKTGQFVSTADRESDIRGFYVNQLYSSTVAPYELASKFLLSKGDRAEEQELFNSKLGLPHIVDGAKITDLQIRQAIKSYSIYDQPPTGKLVTMGVDVGGWLHYEIAGWDVPAWQTDINMVSRPQVLTMGKVTSFEELDQLMRQWQVQQCVIDANPERRKAYEFACRFWGHVRLCFYGRGVSGKMMHLSSEDEGSHTVTVDRTSWLDVSLGRFFAGTIALPRETPIEYQAHLKNIVRIYQKDADGNPVGKYVSGGADHYAHSRTYNEIALPLAASAVTNRNIRSFL